MTPVDLAWAAGLYEGEGTIGCYNGGRVQLKIKMTDLAPIQRFAALFGLDVHGPYDTTERRKDGGFRKPTYQVQVYGPVAERVYLMLRDQLSGRRREQGDAALKKKS